MANLPDLFAAHLNAALRKRKLSNRWLAQRVGKSEPWISALLKGSRRTPLEVYGQIADHLGIAFTDFFGDAPPVIPDHVLSDGEADLIKSYRHLESQQRGKVDDFVEWLAGVRQRPKRQRLSGRRTVKRKRAG